MSETIVTQVDPGETLSEIAARYDVSVEDLQRWNGIENPDFVQSGQTIIVHVPVDSRVPDLDVGTWSVWVGAVVVFSLLLALFRRKRNATNPNSRANKSPLSVMSRNRQKRHATKPAPIVQRPRLREVDAGEQLVSKRLTGETYRIVEYWRSCLADSVLRTSRFRQTDIESDSNVSLLEKEVDSGRLAPSSLSQIFAERQADAETVEVCLHPEVWVRNKWHGMDRWDGWPQFLAPIATFAEVDREGRIWPQSEKTVIARDVLEPLPEGSFSIGAIDALDTALTQDRFVVEKHEGNHESNWRLYRKYCRKLMDEVAGDWFGKKDQYKRKGGGFAEIVSDSTPFVRAILKAYDCVLSEQPKALLLERYARTEVFQTRPLMDDPLDVSTRLGHVSDKFPLAASQRQVLAHLAIAEQGEILAVNGPPGTGKTTLLLSAVASEWIRAARAKGDPQVIAAASTNNQAVTNIIDAFGKDVAEGSGRFAGRWLPDIKSFGLYLPARSREREAAKEYQTESWLDTLETVNYVKRATDYYLKKAGSVFPKLKQLKVESVIEEFSRLIDSGISQLEHVEKMRRMWMAAKEERERVLGPNPRVRLSEWKGKQAELANRVGFCEETVRKWARYRLGEPFLLLLFGFLPVVAERRRLRARIFLEELGYEWDFSSGFRLEDVEPDMERRVREALDAFRQKRMEVGEGQNALDGERQAKKAYGEAIGQLMHNGNSLKEGSIPSDTALVGETDKGLRFRLFQFATHYWEGRWLLEMRKLPAIKKQRKDNQEVAMSKWRRRMMLTPCMVATCATLPNRMKVSRRMSDGFEDVHLWNFVDLLIVDEAGQVLPEVAGASFALAKKALVIGDTQQLEPIALLPTSVDEGNLIRAGVLRSNSAEKDRESIEQLGIASSMGSTMRIAQAACAYEAVPEMSRGLWLFEHRRCFNEIAEFCNVLCYQGKLEPCRGSAVQGRLHKADMRIPPLGYVHLDGLCERVGGSRRNSMEAEAIALWLASNRRRLEKIYEKRLEEIVGVVTPFAGQVQQIRRDCKKAGIRVGISDGMTVGTVHSLQGADRKIVVFSPTYSKHADGGFIDRSPSMLNVAVSRAKDSFLAFGDMDLFASAPKGTPRHLLGEFLFSNAENELPWGLEVPGRADLKVESREVEMLQDAA